MTQKQIHEEVVAINKLVYAAEGWLVDALKKLKDLNIATRHPVQSSSSSSSRPPMSSSSSSRRSGK